MAKSQLEEYFALLLNAYKIDKYFVREYKFHLNRKWRFDFADVENKIAVEIQGGSFIGGSHVRGGFLRKQDEKLNMAAAMGWRVFFYIEKPEMTSFPELYKKAILHKTVYIE